MESASTSSRRQSQRAPLAIRAVDYITADNLRGGSSQAMTEDDHIAAVTISLGVLSPT
jgi:hypothetical protein